MPNESVKNRHVHAYLTPCNISFLKKFAEANGVTKSNAVNEAVKALKACQPPQELDRILSKKP